MDPKTISLSTISRREEIPFVLNNRGLQGSGVEVGVQRGVFSEAILRNWEGSKLYLVDIWRPSGDSADPANVALPLHPRGLDRRFAPLSRPVTRFCVHRRWPHVPRRKC
jgi:hypothetical protein